MILQKKACQKRLRERKTSNSISATTFKSTRDSANGVWNLKSWGRKKLKKSLKKFLLPGKGAGSSRLSPRPYDSKSSTLLGLVAALWAQMLDLSLCSSHEARSFAEVRRGLYEVQSKMFSLSQLFNKRCEYGSRCSAEACLEVSGWGVE